MEIRDRDTGKRYWLWSFSSPELVARAYDIKVFGLCGCRAKINFPFDNRDVSEPVDPRVVSRREVRDNQLAFEQIETERYDEAYMAELRAHHLELVAEELQVYELYKKRADGAGSSTNPSSSEDGNDKEGSGDDGVNWDKLEADED